MPTKFGVIVPQGWRLDLTHIADPQEKYAHMTAYAREAERLKFESIWLYDHFHTVPTQELETTFECWISTAALARDTSTVRIGQMVTCNNYRPPSLLAKMASTVDVLSGGRLDFGIGAGWYEEEFKAYGYDYPDGPERLRMLDEAMQVIKAMWTEKRATFEGKYYSVNGAINEPKGVQKPHIPMWVAGGGEKVTLRLVAKYGDACNIGVGASIDPAQFRHKYEVLRGHCENLGRDYNSIIKSGEMTIHMRLPGQSAKDAAATTLRNYSRAHNREYTFEELSASHYIGTVQETTDLMGGLVDAGTEYIIVYLNDLARMETMQLFAEEVMPAFTS